MRTLKGADLLCGAGGTTTGLIRAAEKLGYQIELHGVNHDPLAIETIRANHPNGTYYCEALERVRPEEVVPEGRLDILVASPECIFFSRARGGRPKNDQSRAIAWSVLNWCERLYIPNVLIENVPEFRDWGPLDKNGHPIKKLKGKTFLAFLRSLRSLGYYVSWKILNCADYGDPTTRERLFILARREHRIRWPEPTHGRNPEPRLFGAVKPWRTAREIIDWGIAGESIFNRRRPLSPNTMRRIAAGLRKYSGIEFVIGQQSDAAPRTVDEPLPTVATAGAISLVEPFLVMLNGTSESKLASSTRPVDEPLPTVVGAPHACLAEPFVLNIRGGNDGYMRGVPVSEPMQTVTASPAMALVEPFILPNEGVHRGNAPRSLDDPLPTVTASRGAGHLVQPFIVQMDNGGSLQSVDNPLKTVTGADARALVEPFLVEYHGTGQDGRERVRSLQQPMPTVPSSPIYGLAEPFIVATNHGPSERAHSLAEPIKTVTAFDAWGFVEPFIVNYNGTGTAHSVDEPLDTVATHDRFGLVAVLKDGRKALLDIRFRMLQPHELARAQGFPEGYRFAGMREKQVKMIGNSVPVATATALCEALLS